MFKLFSIVLIGAGVAFGVVFADEIKGVWQDTPIDQIENAAEGAMDFVSEKLAE